MRQEIADLKKGFCEAMMLHAPELEEHLKTFADASAGFAGVKKAISFLKEFCDNGFVQTSEKLVPE